MEELYPPKENTKEQDEEDEEQNPAQILALTATIEETPKLNIGPLTNQQQVAFQNLIAEYEDICARSSVDLRQTHLVQHKINTGDALPIAQPPYRLNPQKKEFLRKEIAEMEKQGVIRKSTSP